MRPKVKLRADGNEKIGLGHIYRMVAFSQILQDAFDCSFIIKNADPFTLNLIASNRCKTQILADSDIDIPEINNNLSDPVKSSEILIVDGYHFDATFQESIKTNIGCKLIYVDDIFNYYSLTDIIINHSGGVKDSDYKVSFNTKLLLGTSYALLRDEFYNLKTRIDNPTSIQHVFLNFGGADSNNTTCEILIALLKHTPSIKQIHVVVGSAFKKHKELEKMINGNSFIKVHKNLDTHEIIKIMTTCDTAICSASTVSYEYCCITGLLFIIQTAENQSLLFNYFISQKIAFSYERFNEVLLSPGGEIQKLRSEQVINQKANFDGNGGKRIKREIYKLYLKDNYFIRRAAPDDIDVYYNWANDEEVRKNSFNSEPISYEIHCNWFNLSMADKNMCLYIFTTTDNIPIASIRFKIENKRAILSYLIDEKFRGIGFGKIVLWEATKKLFEENYQVQKIVGYVKGNNLPSINAFFATGFIEESDKNNVKCFSKSSHIKEVA
ncbi:MAG: UDP-2,4-diacetamido-2,4,6-trideoxy-beta-L-altropyranose hydrolase [Chitinophagaceae bacterium]